MDELQIKEFDFETMNPSCVFLALGSPSSGKCLGEGTPIRLFNGDVKPVEKITKEDQLMGDDGKPRNILSLARGRDKMYKINPIYSSSSFRANGAHILCLKQLKPFKGSDVKEISIDDFLKLSEIEQSEFALYKSTTIEFKEDVSKDDEFDPFFMGQMFGEFFHQRDNKLTRHTKYGIDVFCSSDSFVTKSGEYNPTERLEEYAKYPIEKRVNMLKGLISNGGSFEDCWWKIFYNTSFITEKAFNILKSICDSVGILMIKTRIENRWKIALCGDAISEHKRNHIFDPTRAPFEIIPQGEDNYYGFQIDGNGRFLLGDFTVTHNTTFIENLVYYTRNKYPVARIWTGSEDMYKKMCKIFHPLYVSNYYDVGEVSKLIARQKARIMENGKNHIGNNCINIIDDLTDDRSIFKSKEMASLFKVGPQHWNMVTMVASQYAIDLPPPLRKCASYVAIFKESNANDRKKLYNNFGGICGSERNFCEILDQVTGDYTCLIIDNRRQSTNPADCLYWYRTKPILEPWKFGCDEYRAHAEERYNTEYTEKL